MFSRPTSTVSVEDRIGGFASQIAVIRDNTLAAFGDWAQYISSNVNIEISVVIENISSNRAAGGATWSGTVRRAGELTILQDGPAFELRTGQDENGSRADIAITIDPDYLRILWLDPNPFDSVRNVEQGKIDATSVLRHEIGHALGFNGYRNWATGALTGSFATLYDTMVVPGAVNTFVGATAVLTYGGPVPLNRDLVYHYANANDASIREGLMNGVAFDFGKIYDIAVIDLAILTDLSVPVVNQIDARSVSDNLVGGPLHDLIFGSIGSDTIVSGFNNDSVVAGEGNDTVVLGEGNDVGLGNPGNDLILGNQGADIVVGGLGNDAVVGGRGADFVFGNENDDVLFGNEENDTVFGGQGSDTVYAGQGGDVIWGNEGGDVLFGNEGADRFVFSSASGADRIMDFRFSEGDRLDLQGQTYTTETIGNGSILLRLSGGGSINLEGISTFQSGYFA